MQTESQIVDTTTSVRKGSSKFKPYMLLLFILSIQLKPSHEISMCKRNSWCKLCTVST